jgi:hypothetical protein
MDGPEQTVIVYGKDSNGTFTKSIVFTHYMEFGHPYTLSIWQDSEVGSDLIIAAGSQARFIKLLNLAPFMGE